MNSLLPITGSLTRMCLTPVLMALSAATLSAAQFGQPIPDGATVEVSRNGTQRQGIVRAYAVNGEYSVEFDDGRREWVPETQVRAVAVIAPAAPAAAGPPDFAPLYQSIGAACGAVMCCVVPAGVAILFVAIPLARRK